MLLFTIPLQIECVLSSESIRVQGQNHHLPDANKVSSSHARYSVLILPVPVFHSTPALAVVGLGCSKRKSVKYSQQYPFYFPGQPIIRIWQPSKKMKAKYLYGVAQKNLQSK